jgi:Electron transfer DM13
MLIHLPLLLTSLALFSPAFAGDIPSSDETTKPNWTGQLSSLDGGLQGTVKVITPTTLVIAGFKLADASAPALYWWGSTDSNLKGGFRISNAQVKQVSTGEDLQVQLDAGKTVADFGTVGLWCEHFGVDFGQATLQPAGEAVPAASATASAKPKSGSAMAALVPLRLAIMAGIAGVMWLFL